MLNNRNKEKSQFFKFFYYAKPNIKLTFLKKSVNDFLGLVFFVVSIVFVVMKKMEKKSYRAPAVKRAVKVIEFLAKKGTSSYKLTEIAKELNFSKSTLHGILHTLVELNWLKKGSNGSYSISEHLFELIKKSENSNSLIDRLVWLAKPFMEEIAEKTNETVFLGVKHPTNPDKVIIKECVEGKKEFNINATPGIKIPLMAGAVGKVFLSELEEKELLNSLKSKKLPKYTDRTITDFEEMFREIKKVKELGYATDHEEYLPGVVAVAVPIYFDKKIIGAMWVVGFSSQFDEKLLKKAKEMLMNASKILSRLIQNQNI